VSTQRSLFASPLRRQSVWLCWQLLQAARHVAGDPPSLHAAWPAVVLSKQANLPSCLAASGGLCPYTRTVLRPS
jgi:hypothetical protein